LTRQDLGPCLLRAVTQMVVMTQEEP
jgi:hypothetical protein